MRKALVFALAFSIGLAPLAFAAPAQEAAPPAPAAQEQQAGQDQQPPQDEQSAQDQEAVQDQQAPQDQQSAYQPYADDQLDNLLAPIALYPDPLLAQVLVAATFADQIDEAARFVRSYGQNGVDEQPWDVSVRAVAHYTSVLNMMDDDLDWTTAVGQAYVYQSTDVMASIQRLRSMAMQQGNLVTTPQQQVLDENGSICIWPASPQYIYVPVYDPSIVFFRRAYFGGLFTGFSFGPAFAIGVWLNLDCDWGRHRVYYTGWQGSGWIARSRPRIRMNPVYVNSRFSSVAVNRGIARRPVNYQGLAGYQSVHRTTSFQNRAGARPTPVRQPAGRVPNKIIDRNIMPNQQINQFRGWQQSTPAPVTRTMPQQPRGFPQARQPVPAPVQRTVTAQPPNAFGRGDSPFNTRAASQRGQQSRTQMNRQPARRPESRSQPTPKSHPAPRTQQHPQRPGGR
jgi:Protein of unknown function (DUF3300)